MKRVETDRMDTYTMTIQKNIKIEIVDKKMERNDRHGDYKTHRKRAIQRRRLFEAQPF